MKDEWPENIVAQVCGVSKALMRVSKITSAGHRVVFEQGNSYIEDMITEERIYLKEENGTYLAKLWVKSNKMSTCQRHGGDRQ